MLFELTGTRAALHLDGLTLSRAELAAGALGHVASLERLGAKPGARIAVVAEPTLAAVAAYVGNACAGYVSVPINPAIAPAELAHVLSDAQPEAFLGSAAFLTQHAVALDGVAALALEWTKRDGTLTHASTSFEPLLVLYTSGTTGKPKGAVLTAVNVAYNLDALAWAWALDPSDTIVHALPLFHVHGLVLGLFGGLRNAGGLRLVPRFSPTAVAEALAIDARPVLFGVPTHYHRLAESCDAAIAGSLRRARLLVSGSAALPAREHQRLHHLAGVQIVERYGLTETLINCALRAGEPKPGYVGRPLDGVEVRLVDEQRHPLDVHDDETLGEVAVRGPNVFAGYLNQPDATAAVVDAEGFFYTGDLAARTADGTIRIAGRRATDLIKTGGFKVGAGEIEAALLESPHVRECAVVGVADPDLGERLVAYVVVGEGYSEDAVLGVARERLSRHKQPRELRVVEALPRNAMGKVQKKLLR